MKYFISASIIVFLFSCTPKVIKELPPIEKQPVTKYLWAYKNTVNVRSDKFASSNKLASLTDGDSVKVLRNENGWYEIILNNGQNGWIRSDLLGTKSMSVFNKAISFSDSLKENENINLYFDKKTQHKCIFLEFPKSQYSSKQNIEIKTNEIGKMYQEKVYNGGVTIQVIEPVNQIEFLTINLSGSATADLNLPVFEFGILEEITILKNTELKLTVSVNENIENSTMLKEARKISGSFPLTFSKVNIAFKNKMNNCLLSFIEDSSGETYKFNQCL